MIEIDGGIHRSKEQKEYDIGREAELERFDIRVIRFTNDEVENGIEQIKKEIELTCQGIDLAHQNCLTKVPFRGFRGENKGHIRKTDH